MYMHITTDISAESELTFDYQWPPSDRKPTICNCNTNSCRGTLEIYNTKTKNNGSGKENNNRLSIGDGSNYDNGIVKRKGQWRKREEYSFVCFGESEGGQNIDRLESSKQLVGKKYMSIFMFIFIFM